jgi:glycine dehydrogenase subunit 1
LLSNQGWIFLTKQIELIHPYIPNSVLEVRQEMLRDIGFENIQELLNIIPKKLRLDRSLNLPDPLPSELDLKKHVSEILSKNKSCNEYLNFLGAGCWQHHVPALVDEIAHRSEFVTAYAGNTYSDLGKWQTFFEFQSMMGELLEMDAVSLPTFDWGTAASFAIRMASRINIKREVLIPRIISPERLSIIKNFCNTGSLSGNIDIKLIDYDPKTGLIDLQDLENKLSSNTSSVYIENPSYLGTIESQGDEIARLTHNNGAELIVGIDPISLGLLTPPINYGGDIVCGEIQPLGIHMNYGGGVGGFIATRDEPRYVSEYPTSLVSITDTIDGGFGFGYCTHDRTLYAVREEGKDFTGTTVGLWTIAAAVYMALLGPNGIKEIGQAIIKKSHYAEKMLNEINGIETLFSPHFFKEFVVNFDSSGKTVNDVNKFLLDHKIFGGKEIVNDFPELSQSSLYCVTEIHSQEDITRLAETLNQAIK